MNIKKTIFGGISLFTLSIALVSCSKDDSGAGDNTGGTLQGSFFISTTTEGDGSIILNTDDLSSGTLTTVGQGIALSSSYTWVFNPAHQVAFGLLYQQGDPGQGLSYRLNNDGTLVKSGADVQIPDRFTTYGPFEQYLVTAVGGVADGTDTLSVFNFFDVENNNAVTRKTVSVSNFAGNGQQATFSGIVDMGNGEFLTGAVLSGARPANSEGGSSTGYVLYPDSCWVAAFDENLNLLRIYRDGRQGYASGRFRSQYYSLIAADENKNCYVFSGAYDDNTTKNASALRINNGASTFDADYYFDIQTAANGYKFRKVWHVIGDYFLLEFYNTKNEAVTTSTGATQYGLVNMTAKTFQWLSDGGFPAMDQITSVGLLTTYDGKAYIPVNTASESPAVYVLDPYTGRSTKGLVVEAASITAVGRLSY